MGLLSSSIGTTQDAIPGILASDRWKFAGCDTFDTLADLNAARDKERANIDAGNAQWRTGMRFIVATEPGQYRVWFKGASGALSHANTVVVAPTVADLALKQDKDVAWQTPISASTYTLQPTDYALPFTADCLLTIPAGLPTTYTCQITTVGSAVVTAQAASGTPTVTLELDGGLSTLSGPGARGLVSSSPTANTILFLGDPAAAATSYVTLTDAATVDLVSTNPPLKTTLYPFQYGSSKVLSAIDADVLPPSILALNAGGFTTAGIGEAQWMRVASQPSHAGKRRSADRYLPNGTVDSANGGWWELSSDTPSPPMIGSPVDGTSDCLTVMQQYLAMLVAQNKKGSLGSFTYCFSDELILNGYKIVLEGDFERTTFKGLSTLNSSSGLKGIVRLRDAAACNLTGINFDSVVNSANSPDAIVLENTGATIPGTTATMSRNKFRNIYVGRNKTGLNFNSAIRLIDLRDSPDNNAENEFQGIHIEGIRRAGIEIVSYNSLDNLIDDLIIMNPTGATGCSGVRTTSRLNTALSEVGGGGFVLGKHYINVHGGIGSSTSAADDCWKFRLEGKFQHDISITPGNGEDNCGYLKVVGTATEASSQVAVKVYDFNKGGIINADYISSVSTANQKIDIIAYGATSNQGRVGGNIATGANCTFTQMGGAIACASFSGPGQVTLNSSKQTAGTITVDPASPRPILNGHVGKITQDGATISLDGVANNWPTQRETIGSRMRKLARSAAISNAITNLPMMAPPAWVTATAKLVGNVVSNAGNWYVACNSATTGANAPTAVDGDAHFDGASSTGVLWAWIGAARILSNDALAPTVTLTTSSQSATYPNVYLPSANPGAYRIEGGYSVAYRTTFWQLYAFDQAASTPASRCVTVSSVVDAPAFVVFLPANSGPLRVRIGDRYLSPEGFNPGAADSFLVVDFSAAGGRQERTVHVETSKAQSYFGAIRVKAVDTCHAPVGSDPVKAAWISDSLMAGSSYGPFAAGASSGHRAGRLLGWSDNRIASSGGTGYVNDAGATLYTYGQRIAEMLTWNPDVWVFMGSTNDIGLSGVQAAALAAFKAIRAGGSMAPIIVFGLWPLNNSGVPTTEALVQAAVTQFADPLGQTWFVPIYGASPMPWVTGAWNNSANTASVNATLYIGGDSTHPIDLGTEMLAARLANGIRSVLSLIT